MTGYGKSKFSSPTQFISTEVKSINSKGLDVIIRMPEGYGEFELDIRNIIAKQLHRGKVMVVISINQLTTQNNPEIINRKKLLELYTQLVDIQKELKLNNPISLETLADSRYLSQTTSEENPESFPYILDSLYQALEQVIQTRKQEGASIQKQFKAGIADITQKLSQISIWEQERIPAIKTKLLQQLNDLKTSTDRDRLEQELIYYLEKLDITEEKKRLAVHLKFFQQTMEKENEAGKKLGFIAQEIGRELNTLGNKANHIEIQQLVVGMKDTLEQIKEQLANVV